ncbi:preprotein translocase subunit SecE [Buchnera aphidicola (Cinara tujafilina)]|uniref:Preprotein translocase subunit SecE n=1 Tax=Buchnera aphidicola (Cinara tujafilina) TaxID=261317 RepID=F7WYX4_9GAMM|nr:preprotein translocase subunit SecE [Buchnera aphidicola]AEH39624.1 preprotein translocase subunit SecE [Buchnera aphidicola (Cinara tujafilina)]
MYIQKIYKKYIYRHIEKIKWCSIILIFILILSNYSFENKMNSTKIKSIIYGALTVLCISSIFFFTKIGKKYLIFLQESKNELKNIIIPKKIDSLKTTLIVIIITALLSLMLWILDNFFNAFNIMDYSVEVIR